MKSNPWILFGLSLLCASPAWAGNGADHGGAGDRVTLESILPRSVTQRMTYDFQVGIYPAPGPYVEKTRCGLVLSCYHSSNHFILDTQTVLVLSPTPHYEISVGRGYYLLNGEWRALRTKYTTTGEIMVWSYGDPDYHTISDGQWVFPYSAFAQGVPGKHITVEGAEQEALPARFRRIVETLFSQTDYGSVTEMKAFSAQMDQLEAVRLSLQPIWEQLDLNFKPFFTQRMEADSTRLFELGKSAVSAQDGTCDTRKYQRLLAELKAWTVGSPAYFYRLRSTRLFTADDQIAALGVRQALRESLSNEVVPYCEAQVANNQSQVDLILNND